MEINDSEIEVLEVKFDLVNKSKFGRGPWDSEPDFLKFIDKKTEYVCLVRRFDFPGQLNGYLEIKKGHPFFRKNYEKINVSVHGGLTFSGKIIDNFEWAIGFDCAHSFDLVPGIYQGFNHGDYRRVNYVIFELKNLAKQIKEVEKKQWKKYK